MARVVSAVVDEMAADERAARVRLLEVVGASIRLEIHRRGVLHRFAEMIQTDSAACTPPESRRARSRR